MAEIRVTPAELKTMAEELEGKNTTLKNKIDELRQKETELSGMWEGEAKTAFHNAFNADVAQMDEFRNVITQFLKSLENIASEYESKEAMNIQMAGRK